MSQSSPLSQIFVKPVAVNTTTIVAIAVDIATSCTSKYDNLRPGSAYFYVLVSHSLFFHPGALD